LTVYCIDSGHIDGNPLTGSAQVTITVTVSNLRDCFFFLLSSVFTTCSRGRNCYTNDGVLMITCQEFF
jgi:hypothetical protein